MGYPIFFLTIIFKFTLVVCYQKSLKKESRFRRYLGGEIEPGFASM